MSADETLVLKECLKKTRNSNSELQKVFDVFEYMSFHFTVMEILGLSLYQIRIVTGPFSVKCIAQIGMNLVKQIQALHTLGYIHQDLKADNILTRYVLAGINEFQIIDNIQNDICLIDFGQVEKFLLDDNKTHRVRRRVQFVAGVREYLSINAIQHVTQSRRDDLISMIYCLIMLATDYVLAD